MFIYESSVNAKTKKLGEKAGNGECKENSTRDLN
jgi:hypothetical protein